MVAKVKKATNMSLAQFLPLHDDYRMILNHLCFISYHLKIVMMANSNKIIILTVI